MLYDAAFAALALRVPRGTRQAITRLTLIGGFASTLFWPLTGWMVDSIGWRGCYMVFAALHLLVALPLHGWIATLGSKAALSPTPPKRPLRPNGPQCRLPKRPAPSGFWASVFALTGITIAAFGVHLVPVLLERGLGQNAYLVGMAMGPTQVLVRVVDATLWRGFHPLSVAMNFWLARWCWRCWHCCCPAILGWRWPLPCCLAQGKGWPASCAARCRWRCSDLSGWAGGWANWQGCAMSAPPQRQLLFAVAQQTIGLPRHPVADTGDLPLPGWHCWCRCANWRQAR